MSAIPSIFSIFRFPIHFFTFLSFFIFSCFSFFHFFVFFVFFILFIFSFFFVFSLIFPFFHFSMCFFSQRRGKKKTQHFKCALQICRYLRVGHQTSLQFASRLLMRLTSPVALRLQQPQCLDGATLCAEKTLTCLCKRASWWLTCMAPTTFSSVRVAWLRRIRSAASWLISGCERSREKSLSTSHEKQTQRRNLNELNSSQWSHHSDAYISLPSQPSSHCSSPSLMEGATKRCNSGQQTDRRSKTKPRLTTSYRQKLRSRILPQSSTRPTSSSTRETVRAKTKKTQSQGHKNKSSHPKTNCLKMISNHKSHLSQKWPRTLPSSSGLILPSLATPHQGIRSA